jgi:hypothetical protein
MVIIAMKKTVRIGTYRDVERLVCPLPEDDALQGRVGHEHPGLVLAWIVKSLHRDQLTQILPVSLTQMH